VKKSEIAELVARARTVDDVVTVTINRLIAAVECLQAEVDALRRERATLRRFPDAGLPGWEVDDDGWWARPGITNGIVLPTCEAPVRWIWRVHHAGRQIAAGGPLDSPTAAMVAAEDVIGRGIVSAGDPPH
jgi:hypothetical protein